VYIYIQSSDIQAELDWKYKKYNITCHTKLFWIQLFIIFPERLKAYAIAREHNRQKKERTGI